MLFNRLFRRYPACTFIGTVSTGLYIKSNDDPFFFLNAWEERSRYDKEKKEFSNLSFMNSLLVIWPSNLREYLNYMIMLIFWAPRIEKHLGRKVLLSTIPITALISKFSNLPDSEKIKNDYIYSLPITWAMINLLIVPLMPRTGVASVYFTVGLLVTDFEKDPRIGAISYLIMKFILKYYVKGPLFTYL